MTDKMQPQGRLTVVPHKRTRQGRVGIPCKRPTCSSVIDPNELGRSKDFCTTPCKERYHREARKALQQLKEEVGIAALYGHRFELVETPASDATSASADSDASTDASAESLQSEGLAPQTLSPTDDAATQAPAPKATDTAGSTGQRTSKPVHEELLKDLLHDVGIAIAQLHTDNNASVAVRRLSERRDDIYAQLAAAED